MGFFDIASNAATAAGNWLAKGDNAMGLVKGLSTIGIGVGGYLNAKEQNKYAKRMLDLQEGNYNYELEKEKKKQKAWDDGVASSTIGQPYIPLTNGSTPAYSARIPLAGV